MTTLLTALCLLIAAPAAAPAARPADAPRVYYGHPDGGNTKDPSVVRFGGRYLMYHSLQRPDGSWGIAVAESDDLLDWRHVQGLDLRPPPGKIGVAAPGALVRDGRVHLFFQSYGGGPEPDRICHAVSRDGVSFERQRLTPIIAPTGDWNNGRAIDAEAFVKGNELLVYWATRDPAGKVQMVGLSKAAADADWSDPKSYEQVSVDGPTLAPTVPTPLDPPDLDLAWEKQCIEAPTLTEHDGRYYLFYAGAYNNDPQQIGVAVSDDAVHFRRLFAGRPLLGPGPAGSWNASESGHPGLFRDDDGKLYLFYQGDDAARGVKWHLSMVPVQWRQAPAGGTALPKLDFDLLPPRAE